MAGVSDSATATILRASSGLPPVSARSAADSRRSATRTSPALASVLAGSISSAPRNSSTAFLPAGLASSPRCRAASAWASSSSRRCSCVSTGEGGGAAGRGVLSTGNSMVRCTRSGGAAALSAAAAGAGDAAWRSVSATLFPAGGGLLAGGTAGSAVERATGLALDSSAGCAAVPAVSATAPSVGAPAASPAPSVGLTTCASGWASSAELLPENRYQPPIVAAASARPAIAIRSAAELGPRGASDLAASRREKSGRTCSSVRSSFSTSWRRSAASTNSRTRGAETGRCRNRYTTPEVIWLATFDCSSAVPTTTSTRSFQVSRRRSASPARSPSMNMLSSSATETRREFR